MSENAKKLIFYLLGLAGLVSTFVISITLTVSKFGSVTAYNMSAFDPAERARLTGEIWVESWPLILLAVAGVLLFAYAFFIRKQRPRK